MAGGKNADLPVRAASAVVVVAISVAALWLGGWAWAGFVMIVAGGVLYEWRALVRAIALRPCGRLPGPWAGSSTSPRLRPC